AAGGDERFRCTCPAELAAVEAIAACRGLRVHAREIRVDRGARRGCRAEARELRMVAIAARAPAQHRLREQRLAPHGGQAGAVEMSWMERPQSHAVGPARSARYDVLRRNTCAAARSPGACRSQV